MTAARVGNRTLGIFGENAAGSILQLNAGDFA
jgi:hypothetical protein